MHGASASSTSSSEPAAAGGSGRRWLAAAAGFALVVALAAAALWTARGRLVVLAAHDSGPIVYARLGRRLESWQRGATAGTARGVVLGDSVLALPIEAPVFTSALSAMLVARGVVQEVADLADYGLGPFQYYYCLERVLAGRPRLAVVEVNLRTFAADWLAHPGLRLPELASGLDLRRALAIRGALASQDLGLLDVAAYRLEARLGLLFVANGTRVATDDVLRAAGARANGTLRLETAPFAPATLLPPVLDEEHALAWYGQDFAARPPAVVLRRMLAELRAAGVVTQLVVAPVNVERLASLGLADGLGARTARLRDAIGATPDEWLEVHGAFHADDFRDPVHLRDDALRRLAALVAAHVTARGVPR